MHEVNTELIVSRRTAVPQLHAIVKNVLTVSCKLECGAKVTKIAVTFHIPVALGGGG